MWPQKLLNSHNRHCLDRLLSSPLIWQDIPSLHIGACAKTPRFCTLPAFSLVPVIAHIMLICVSIYSPIWICGDWCWQIFSVTVVKTDVCVIFAFQVLYFKTLIYFVINIPVFLTWFSWKQVHIKAIMKYLPIVDGPSDVMSLYVILLFWS